MGGAKHWNQITNNPKQKSPFGSDFKSPLLIDSQPNQQQSGLQQSGLQHAVIGTTATGSNQAWSNWYTCFSREVWVDGVSISFLKTGPTLASFSFIFGLFKETIQFLQQINVKKCHVHSVYIAGIQTHDLQNVSLLP